MSDLDMKIYSVNQAIRMEEVAYNQALEDLLKVMKERADDCSDIPNMFDRGYYQAYEHMCYEAEQLKK